MLYRVATHWGERDHTRTSYRYYWDLEKGALRHGISTRQIEGRKQWIEEAEIGLFWLIEPT